MENKFKRKLMFKIYGIWLVRKVLPMIIFEVLFIILAIHLFAGSVFVARVLENIARSAANEPVSIVSYLWMAFWNTRLEVKLEIFIALIFGALFLWSIKKVIISYELIKRGSNGKPNQ